MTEQQYKKFRDTFTTAQLKWLNENVDEFPGDSDDEIIANAARLLYANGEWTGKNETEAKENGLKLARLASKGTGSFDLQNLAQAAGFSDRQKEGKNVSAAKQFLEAYFGGEKDQTTRDLWRANIADKYGDGSWEKAKKVLQGALVSQMEKDIEKNRADIIEGNADDQGLDDWTASALYGLFAPRSKRASKEGRSPSGSEIAGDVLSSILYAIPATEIAKPAQMLAMKLPGVASKVAEKAIAGASQFAVPGAVYGVDKVLGNETDLNDPLLGGLANMGVNKVLGPAVGRLTGVLGGKISSRLPAPLREAIEGAQSPRKKALQLVESAKQTAKEVRQPEKEYENAFKRGIGSEGKWDRIREAEQIIDVADWADDLSKNVKEQLDDAVKFGKDLRKEGKNAGDMGYSPEEFLAREIAKVENEGAVDFTNEAIQKTVEKDKQLFEKHPELMTLFMKEPALFSRSQPKRPTAEGILDGLIAFGVNKYGGDQTGANVAAQALTFGQLDPKEVRKDQQRRRVEKAEAKAADILSVADYTGDDLKYLSMIKAKPDIVKVGLDDLGENTKFKNWLLLRGNDILREQNSPLVRNTFSVE